MSIQNFVLILLALSVFSCSDLDKQRSLELTDLKQVLALGRMTDLNAQSPEQERELFIRLYEVPVFENNCFVETHGICQYEYFISVSSYDEYPEINVYKIPYLGELSQYSWLADETLDQERIKFSFAKYSKAALNNNPALVNQQRDIIATIGLRSFVTSIE